MRAANGGIASLLQSARPEAGVAELGSLAWNSQYENLEARLLPSVIRRNISDGVFRF